MDSQVLKGNCFDILPTLPEGQFQTAFLDPPYNLGLDYGNGRRADRLPADEYLDQMSKLARLCVERLTPTGSIWFSFQRNGPTKSARCLPASCQDAIASFGAKRLDSTAKIVFLRGIVLRSGTPGHRRRVRFTTRTFVSRRSECSSETRDTTGREFPTTSGSFSGWSETLPSGLKDILASFPRFFLSGSFVAQRHRGTSFSTLRLARAQPFE